MSIALVGAWAVQGSTANYGISASIASPAANVPAGALISTGCSVSNGIVPSVSDTAGNAYIVLPLFSGTAAGVNDVYIAYCLSALANTANVVTWTATGTNIQANNGAVYTTSSGTWKYDTDVSGEAGVGYGAVLSLAITTAAAGLIAGHFFEYYAQAAQPWALTGLTQEAVVQDTSTGTGAPGNVYGDYVSAAAQSAYTATATDGSASLSGGKVMGFLVSYAVAPSASYNVSISITATASIKASRSAALKSSRTQAVGAGLFVEHSANRATTASQGIFPKLNAARMSGRSSLSITDVAATQIGTCSASHPRSASQRSNAGISAGRSTSRSISETQALLASVNGLRQLNSTHTDILTASASLSGSRAGKVWSATIVGSASMTAQRGMGRHGVATIQARAVLLGGAGLNRSISATAAVSARLSAAVRIIFPIFATASISASFRGSAALKSSGYVFDPNFYARIAQRNFYAWQTLRTFYATMPSRNFYAQPRRNMPAINLPYAKDPREVKTITICAAADLPPGATLTGTPVLAITVTRGHDPNPLAAFGTPVINSASITVPGASAPIAANMAVQIPATGGVDGCWYEIAITCGTSAIPDTETLKAVLMVSAS